MNDSEVMTRNASSQPSIDPSSTATEITEKRRSLKDLSLSPSAFRHLDAQSLHALLRSADPEKELRLFFEGHESFHLPSRQEGQSADKSHDESDDCSPTTPELAPNYSLDPLMQRYSPSKGILRKGSRLRKVSLKHRHNLIV